MKVISLEFLEKNTVWNLPKIEFDELTLLVGASGVGKTKILKALNNLRRLALDKSINKRADLFKWSLEFFEGGNFYKWSGETEKPEESVYYLSDELSDAETINKPIITFERLVKFNLEKTVETVIFNRINSEVQYEGEKVPKVSPTKSCISIFSEDELLIPVKKAFQQLYFFDFEVDKRESFGLKLNLKKTEIKELDKYDNNTKQKALETVKEINAPIMAKLTVVYEIFPEFFERIKEDYIGIFNRVEDIRFFRHGADNDDENYELQIKEFGSEWISFRDMSSGMLKSLLYLAYIYLTPNNSVIIIDEFENSLGVNCIDILTLNTINDSGMQFILTSHHPYIINKISMDYWKIVSREGNKVIVRDCSFYDLGKSKHEAFKQLLNLTAFSEGREDY
ncbi:AAA family ATPase [Candidatus Pristimantibacillus sp. PTI5]|uniref:AAA family ATPase n=1 Tax=Candidatus Pristimantibacillus sp. PTI5 TaxID=3400422 RepID=UPI003B024C23